MKLIFRKRDQLKSGDRMIRKMHSISNKLLISIFVFSSFVTMLITFIQLYIEYEEGLLNIEKEVNYIKERQTGPLAYAVWTLNMRQADAIGKSISYSPNISYIQIADPKTKFLVEYGDASEQADRVVSHRLIHYLGSGTSHDVGIIRLNVSYNALHAHLKKQVIFVLLGQSVQTFLVSFFILWLVGVWVIKDLNMMAAFFGKLQFPRDTGKTFPRRKRRTKDEFGVLTDSFNDMTTRLACSYKQIRAWNDGLEDVVAQRMVDIKKLQEKNAHLIRVLCHDMANSSMAISLVEYKLRRILGQCNKSNEQEIELEKLTKTLKANSKRQQEILKQVRDVILAPERESILVDFEMVNVDLLFEEVIQNFDEQLRGKNISVNKIITGVNRRLQVDYSVFKNNILSNLMSNAIKYSFEQSSIELKFHSLNSVQYISVVNHGKRMSPQEIGNILSLRRVESNLGTRGERGSGIGLMIVQKCLQAHNGHLEILQGDSQDPYIEFRLHLPINKEVNTRTNLNERRV